MRKRKSPKTAENGLSRRDFMKVAGVGAAASALAICGSHFAEDVSEFIFINGKVYTMNPAMKWAEAVAIRGNTIIAVGRNRDVEKLITPKTKLIDLKGKMMLPGLIESHIHPALGSIFANMIILNQNADKKEIMAELKKGLEVNKDYSIIGFIGFQASAFGTDGPTAAELDALENKKPVLVFDYGGHSLWVNTPALKLANITKDTPDPIPGGHYYKRDKNGNPTGWCIEPMSYLPIIYKLGLTPQDFTDAQKKLYPLISANGYTTVFDAGSILEDLMFQSYQMLEREKKLPFRVFGCHMISNPNLLDGAINELARLNKTYASTLLKINTLKIVYDGTLEAFSCAMFDDFLNNKGKRGFELFPPEVLSSFVKKVDDAGWNIHIHAIGNKAISDVLSAFENLKSAKGLTPTRKTICHLQFFMPNTVERFRQLQDVVAQTTPIWMVQDTVTLPAVGKTIYESQMLFKSLDKAGVKVTFGSDYPASSGLVGLNPFNEIEVGALRRDLGEPDSNFLPPESERLSVETLLRGYTINGAYQLGMEHMLGSIQVGKLADLIVIDKDILQQKVQDIHTNKVLMTMMDGNIVYNRL